jgi:outer membrane biogenesis lipoprotein LolB
MWKAATVIVAILVLTACDAESRKEQLKEQLKQAQTEQDSMTRIDDARCQSYGKPGSNAYVQCLTSLKNERADMRESETPKPKGQ